jgi:hypothetical protein
LVADAEVAAETFGDDDALTTFAMPARFGSKPEMTAGIMRSLATSGSPAPVRAMQIARGMPRAADNGIRARCAEGESADRRPGLMVLREERSLERRFGDAYRSY